jgi:hypothetical protein
LANDKKFVVKNGLTTQNISFVDDTQSTNNTITVTMLGSDTLSFSGDSGQLFSITDSLSGTIFAVNDISGVPSIEVDDDGTIRFAETFGNVLIGTATDTGEKLQVNGKAKIITVDNGSGDFLTRDANGVVTRRTSSEVLTDIGAEGAFTKGNLIQGDRVTLSGTLTNRLVGSGDVTISAAATNLGITAGTTAGPIVTSSTGTDATLPTASASASGVITTGNQTFAGVKTFNSTITGSISGNAGTATTLQTARTLTIGSTGKTFNGSANVAWTLAEIGVNNSTLTLATSGIATGSQTWTSNQGTNATFTVNVPATNLAMGGSGNSRTITSSTGTDVSVPVVTTTNAGFMATGDKTKLDGIETGAQVNTVTSVAGKTGAVTLTNSDVGLGNVTNHAQVRKLASSTNGNVPIWNGTTGDQLSNGYGVETTLVGNSSNLARADAIKAYVDGILASNDAMIFKGTLGTGGTYTALPTTHNVGWTIKVITAGTYAGQVAEVGDMYISLVSRSGSGNQNSDWAVIQVNIDGAVTGPASSVNDHVALFNGTTGKVIKSSGSVLGNGTLTLATSGIATGSQTFGANQNTNATFTVNVPATNLAMGGSGNSRTITSSTGTDVSVPVVTTTNAGFMATGDKTKLDGIETGAQVNVATNLTYSTAATTGTVNSSTGTNATIPAATTSLAGLMTNTDKTKLDGIEAGAQVNVGTNLGITAGTTAGPIVTSSTGTDATLPTATASASGVITTGNQTFAGVKTFNSTITGSVSGNAGTATTLQTARTIGGVSFNGSANINLPGVNIEGNQNTTGTSSGVIRTVTGTNSAELVRGNMGDNDQARILVGATASNAGFLEIATADDGTEPIHVRQYTGVFTTLTRTATLLDGSGNTSFPGTVTAPTFSGALSGNATTATTLQTARTINGVSFNGSANITITANTPQALTAGSGITSTGTFNGSTARTFEVDSTVIRTSGNQIRTSGLLELRDDTFANQLRIHRTGGANYSVIQYFSNGAEVGKLGFTGTGSLVARTLTNSADQLTLTTSGVLSTSGGFSGALSGNATTATTLQTARNINGTSFNGSADITTANWGTARTITIGATGKSVNGSINVAWTLAEIGAADRNLTLTGGDGINAIGNLTANRTISVDSTVVRTSGNQTIGGIKTFNQGTNSTSTTTGSIVLSGSGGLGVGGDVNVGGTLNATAKSFFIDHPTKSGMKLRYGSLESPYHGVRLTGEGTIKDDTATIDLPDYIHGLCKQEGAQVQITNIKHGKVLWVEDIFVDDDCFVIGMDRDANDEEEYKFYWSFTAIRKDIEDMVVETE